MNTPADQTRAQRRRREHERQAVVFGSLTALLAIAAFGAAAVYTNTIELPFLNRDFTTVTPTATAAALPPVPCPVEDSLPLAYSAVTVNVFNASERPGLAGQTADALTTRGFVVGETSNYPASIDLPVEILFGQEGVAAAYTLASQFRDVTMILDARADTSVDLLLGVQFPGLLDPSEVTLDPSQPLIGATGCVPIAEALPEAYPAPVASTPTEETATEPADG
jgi:hypothetical protein